ncbi:MAG TPA: alpha/beta fold hydrolase, partial [Oscillatoriaceae cyanobacterium]
MRLPVPTPPEFDALAQREVIVDGARIAYTEAGDGPPVLLLHGAVFGGNVFWWETQQALAPHVRTIAPDFIGWGASDKPRAPYTLDTYRAFISGFLDALGLDQVVIAGHSMGGILGSAYALLHPERVSRLFLLAVPPAWADFELPNLFRPFLTPLLGELIMFSTPYFGTENPLGIRRFYESLFHDPRRIAPDRMRSMLHACCAATAEPAHREAFLNTIRSIRGEAADQLRSELREHLPRFERPTRLLAGMQDPLFPLSVIQAGAAMLPGAKLDVLD